MGKHSRHRHAVDGKLHDVVIDTPKGSRSKYKYDPEIKAFRLAHVLPAGSMFPYDFGSIEGTRAPDGDPLDVLVLSEVAAFVGCVMKVRLLGGIAAKQKEKGRTLRNDRLIGVAETKVNRSPLTSIDDLDNTLLEELEQFFAFYNRLHGREFKPVGRFDVKEAERIVADAMT